MHRDRLLSFGAEIIFAVCDFMGTDVIILEHNPVNNLTEQICMDLVEIINLFTNKIYGMLSISKLKAFKMASVLPQNAQLRSSN
jgi:predicted site-specific integrase-resolvase